METLVNILPNERVVHPNALSPVKQPTSESVSWETKKTKQHCAKSRMYRARRETNTNWMTRATSKYDDVYQRIDRRSQCKLLKLACSCTLWDGKCHPPQFRKHKHDERSKLAIAQPIHASCLPKEAGSSVEKRPLKSSNEEHVASHTQRGGQVESLPTAPLQASP